MKNFFKIFAIIILISGCKKEPVYLPVGFEHISQDGPSHFVYVHEEFLGQKLQQKDAGRIICKKIFVKEQYCEVYYFEHKQEVPLKFPITDRINPFGLFEFKNGREKFKLLGDKPIKYSSTVFYKESISSEEYKKQKKQKLEEDKIEKAKKYNFNF
jgi:hypothetical protein